MVYLIHWNMETGFRFTAQCADRQSAEFLMNWLKDYELIEVGVFSFWLFRRGFRKLAMLPFWR